ncbi:MAG: ATP-binding cassette domain-containing protein [Geminicoccaceae bacterium]|nr:ATP-binding cassette domain-containing protein [Geminicoccaceae bacterium]
MSGTLVEVRGLVTRFGPKTIHDGLDLDVREGEVLAVIGGSGTGKSVLLRLMLGLMRPAWGSVRVFGADPAVDRRATQGRIGVLFQDGALFSSLTVAENVQVPLKEGFDLSPDLLDELAALKLALVGLPPDAGAKLPSELSGGMRKRAGLARALALDPELVFLDEPTAGLDPIGASAFDRLIRGLQQSLGLAVVMITHDVDSILGIADRVAAIVDRRIVAGTADELRQHPHPWLKDYFGGPRGRDAATAHGAVHARGEAPAARARIWG